MVRGFAQSILDDGSLSILYLESSLPFLLRVRIDFLPCPELRRKLSVCV